jgi:hypothetical protein
MTPWGFEPLVEVLKAQLAASQAQVTALIQAIGRQHHGDTPHAGFIERGHDAADDRRRGDPPV